MDDAKISKLLPGNKVVEVKGKKFGLCHGSGSPHKLGERVYQEFGERCHVLIFGHSHVTYNRKMEDTLLFNPRSLSGNMMSPFTATYGVLNIEGDDVWAEIFELK